MGETERSSLHEEGLRLGVVREEGLHGNEAGCGQRGRPAWNETGCGKPAWERDWVESAYKERG
jgi:hypothetical protein